MCVIQMLYLFLIPFTKHWSRCSGFLESFSLSL
uniref:Uncharacterized protein n=1 Tax=Arundo donax TaxID=35708 RepID=A0A0A9EZW5_ARUDO